MKMVLDPVRLFTYIQSIVLAIHAGDREYSLTT